jgi:hypothetical protein
MGEPDMQKYCDLMEEIKRRISVMDFFLTGGGHAMYMPTTVESVGLQLRKVLELTAFGSLVANKDVYAEAYEEFASHWNARLLLRDLERVNCDFYPRPIVEAPLEAPHPNTKVLHQLKDREPDYLSREEFEKAYEKCGAIMHAENPYGSRVDYNYYLEKLPAWRTQVVNLLNNHKMRLVGENQFYLVHMKENRDDKVHYYKFERQPATN